MDDSKTMAESRGGVLENVEVIDFADTGCQTERRPLRKKVLAVIWDSLDKTPEERKFIAKLDWWILTYACVAYFVKFLDQTNVSRESIP